MYRNIDTFFQGFANGGMVSERGRGSIYDSYRGAKKKEEEEKKRKIIPSPVVNLPSFLQEDYSVPVDPFTSPDTGNIASDPEFLQREGGASDYTLPGYIADHTPIVGKSYGEIASDTVGDVGEYIYNNPKQAAIDSARGLGSLLVGDFAQTGEIADFDLFGGIQDAGEQVYDSAKTLLTNDYFKYKPWHTINMATNPEYATAHRENKLGDIATVVGAGLPVKPVFKGIGSAIKGSDVSKALRGELGESFYGPDGPAVKPNVGGFELPYSSKEAWRRYIDLRNQGLSNAEIERLHGLKVYSSGPGGSNQVIGIVKPSNQIDTSDIPYEVKNTGPYGGWFDPSDNSISISDKAPVGSANFKEILRHEGEHLNQRKAGLGSHEFGTGSPESIFRRQRRILEDLNQQIRGEKDPSTRQALIVERDRVADIDAAGAYYNSPKEVGARQAQLGPVRTYDPTITATELLDPTINIGKGLGTRVSEAFSRAILPTHRGLSRFREMSPRIPFTNSKLFTGFDEAFLPLARMNTPRTPSTRGNQSVPFLGGSRGNEVNQGRAYDASVDGGGGKGFDPSSIAKQGVKVGSGIPKVDMIEGSPAGINNQTVTQSAVNLINEPAFGEGFAERLSEVAAENSIAVGDRTFMPMDVYTELADRVNNPDFKVVDPKATSGFDFVEEFLSENKPKSANLEFTNKKKEMIGEGMSGSDLEFALNNLARRLGIERPD